MNQTSHTIHNLSSVPLFNGLNFQFIWLISHHHQQSFILLGEVGYIDHTRHLVWLKTKV